MKNGNRQSGIFTIYINNNRSHPVDVYCDMDTDGGGWLVQNIIFTVCFFPRGKILQGDFEATLEMARHSFDLISQHSVYVEAIEQCVFSNLKNTTHISVDMSVEDL